MPLRAAPIALTPAEHRQLTAWARAGTTPQRLARRARLILGAAAGATSCALAQRVRVGRTTAVLVHTPVHASWRNQIELSCSILQRKALTPNDFAGLREVEARLLAFARRYTALGRAFTWGFTRRDLERRLRGLAHPPDASEARLGAA